MKNASTIDQGQLTKKTMAQLKIEWKPKQKRKIFKKHSLNTFNFLKHSMNLKAEILLKDFYAN